MDTKKENALFQYMNVVMFNTIICSLMARITIDFFFSENPPSSAGWKLIALYVLLFTAYWIFQRPFFIRWRKILLDN